MLAMPPGDSGAEPEGTNDEHPISVPNVRAIEFRSLLDMIYLPYVRSSRPVPIMLRIVDDLFRRSDTFFTTLESQRGAWLAFVFYLDVARLAHKFCMDDFEQWARDKLKSLLVNSSKDILDVTTRKRVSGAMPRAYSQGLVYARLVLDFPLRHSLRNLLQCYFVVPAPLATPGVLSAFRQRTLRQEDPAMFGFLFLLLLNSGHQEWDSKLFTRRDRIALFSAQSYLTPPPESLGVDFTLPLLVRPIFTTRGYLHALTDSMCSNECHRRLSSAWKKAFGSDYYPSVVSNEALRATSALATLPKIRFEFASIIRPYLSDKDNCSSRTLQLMDEEIHQLYVKLGGYYRDLD